MLVAYLLILLSFCCVKPYRNTLTIIVNRVMDGMVGKVALDRYSSSEHAESTMYRHFG